MLGLESMLAEASGPLSFRHYFMTLKKHRPEKHSRRWGDRHIVPYQNTSQQNCHISKTSGEIMESHKGSWAAHWARESAGSGVTSLPAPPPTRTAALSTLSFLDWFYLHNRDNTISILQSCPKMNRAFHLLFTSTYFRASIIT